MGVSDLTLLMLFVRLPAAKSAGKWVRVRLSLRECGAEANSNSNNGGERAAAARSPRLCGQARNATRTESTQQPLCSLCLCQPHAGGALGLG
ncbi:hypothetical protein B0H13DRAFT_2075923 [Mycena leptocephala]|nr:hypothetical protein B0H13DRAFT_2119123 [Mycena leptocephala]KAJ7858590.1 hypothetical protein B0H13DRAFT_2075923 [Mycena leptocephala]